ncbi:alpha/beta fold hydrolase [Nonomuraea sp. SBT364]|uniref:alpha/beta fold hydrolase n=1 Tax=Nonomuraea sp. SBT364 TaxID=1580530 RepID=UPI00066B02EA|nr:alpha/beta hydrolase [Nonomuraea sp. SBT364]
MHQIILLPGGGRTSTDWRLAAPLLEAAGVRAVAVDLPELGTWSWAGAVEHLSEAIDDHGLENPAVAGHSLGGIVAALWAAQHPECPLAVNLDGHTNPTGPFDGIDPVEAERTMRAFLAGETAGDPELTHFIAQMDALDLIPVYRAARCPLLVVSSTGSDLSAMLPPDVSAAFDAYVRGFSRELTEAAARTPLLSLADMATGHDMHLEAPYEVVSLILGHLRGGERRGASAGGGGSGAVQGGAVRR